MNIVIAINKAYIPYVSVMLTSLFCQHSCPIDIYVLHHELTSEDEAVLCRLSETYEAAFHFLYIPDSLLPPAEVKSATPWGIETYFRLAILDLLPADAHRAVYLDADMIVNKPLDALYSCDLQGKKIAACYELSCHAPFGDYRDALFCELIPDGFTYFNAGMMLLDLDALRPQYGFDRYMAAAAELNYQIQFPDQDLLNYCHHGEVLHLDFRQYNLFARRAYTDFGMRYEDVKENVSVIHYTNEKPWRGNCLHCDIELLWWDYAKKTPFYHDLLVAAARELMFDTTVRAYSDNIRFEQQQLMTAIDTYEQIFARCNIPFTHPDDL